MAEAVARALYDFETQAPGELSIRQDEELFIVNKDVGDGWCEARNSAGETGFIPVAYVLIASDPDEPAFPPPPAPQPAAAQGWTDSTSVPSWNQPATTANADQWSNSYEDTYDSDFDDYPEQSGTAADGVSTGSRESASTARDAITRRSASAAPTTTAKGTASRGLSRLSKFVKTGCESYLLGHCDVSSPYSDVKVNIDNSSIGPMWRKDSNPYKCEISDHSEGKKFKGLKKFVTYNLTTSIGKQPVQRRYKQFDWLHQRLAEKYPISCVSPLPDKQVTGRFDDEFIKGRRAQLQKWIERMVRHPVIARNEAFIHFLTCPDEKRWKEGKRKAESDRFQGGSWFVTVEPPLPLPPVDSSEAEVKVDAFSRTVKSMTDAVTRMSEVMSDMSKRNLTSMNKEHKRIGQAFQSLAQSYEGVEVPGAAELKASITHCGATYEDIAKLYEEQPNKDSYPVLDTLHEYKGLLSMFPDILSIQKNAVGKYKECSKVVANTSDMEGIAQRCDLISYATLAEMNHYLNESTVDMKEMIREYLQQQIEFHKKVAHKLEESLQKFQR